MAAANQSQQPPPPSAEEEALKRNTDCVYFLASPLTCKKGSECEYRHSEYARVNPRDCYYWLNGNCLNPKCGFRHPPLDGLLGTQVPVSAAPSLTPSQAVTPSSTHASQGSGKQAVPCIFFQKGFCLKGDKCAFSHGTNPMSNKVLQPIAPNPGSEPQSGKKAFSIQSCSQELKIPQPKISKPVDPPQVKPSVTIDAPARSNMGTARNVPPPKSMNDEVPKHKGMISPLVVNGNTSRSNHMHVSQVADDSIFLNGRDGDELLRDSSPGFDVLVDDELRDSDYYHGDDQYGRTGDHEGRNLNSVDEYDLGHSADYNSMGDHPLGYDSYEHMQGQYVGDQHMASSERVMVGSARLERRGRTGSPESIDELDLRHHLSMQRRRFNGLRSVVNPDFVPDSFTEERGYRGSSRRESHRTPSRENSISSRLRGRLKLPARSADNGSDLYGEMDRGRNLGKLSPGRSQAGRFRDRSKDRVEEEYNEGRNIRGRMRREIMDGSSDFVAPKRLAELKVSKNVEGGEQQPLRKRKYSEDCQPSEGSFSFEGPLSLAEILKRKRESEGAASGGVVASSVNAVGISNNSNEANKDSLNNAAVMDAPTDPPPAGEDSSTVLVKKDKTELKSALGKAGESIKVDQGSSQPPNNSEVDIEEGMIVDQGVENHEYEGDDPREEDYEYEQVDEGDYNNEEGENIDAEEEYADEEDDGEEDDFAKKIGVMFS